MQPLLSGSAVVTLAISTAVLAVTGQGTQRPGQMTKASVFIENRGASQAIPVVLPNSAPVVVSLKRQVWEYRSVVLTVGQDVAMALTAVGLDGWETTGLQVTDGTRIAVLLKRPQ
jgi:hypothetical protein